LNAGTDDAAEAAGRPFFDQLITHDITADRSAIDGGADPDALRNARTPKLNLPSGTMSCQDKAQQRCQPRSLAGFSTIQRVMARSS